MTDALSSSSGPAGVWARLWRAAPDLHKDRAELDREQRGPRWRRFAAYLVMRHTAIAGLNTVELGAGRGDLSVLLARAGARVTLVDYCDAALERARERFSRLGLNAEFVRADLLTDVANLAGRFDAAVSVGVVEHFRGRERTRAITAHARVLRAGGTAMISVPNAWCLPYRTWKAYLQIRRWWPYGVEIPYTRRELRRRACAAGLVPARMFADGWRRSICAHWGRGIFHRSWSGAQRSSWLDRWGYDLVLIADQPR